MLDRQSQDTVEKELEAGEQVLWVGRPIPMRSALQGSTIATTAFGVVWLSFVVNFIVMWNGGSHRDVSGPFNMWGMQGLVSQLFFLPFLVIGVVMLLTPVLTYTMAKRTVYAVTNLRALIISESLNRSRKVQSYNQSDISDITRTERPDGAGDVAFAKRAYQDRNGYARTADVKFIGIPDARSVEDLLRKTFARTV